MTTADIMHCRFCNKYIGFKNDVDDYFFHCDKKCHDEYENIVLERSTQTLKQHHANYANLPKPKFGNNEVVAIEDTKSSKLLETNKEEKKTRKKRKKSEEDE